MSDDERFAPTESDGFRPRRKRTKADMKHLITDGVVREPGAPRPESRVGDGPAIEDRGDVFVVRPPAATMAGESKE